MLLFVLRSGLKWAVFSGQFWDVRGMLSSSTIAIEVYLQPLSPVKAQKRLMLLLN